MWHRWHVRTAGAGSVLGVVLAVLISLHFLAMCIPAMLFYGMDVALFSPGGCHAALSVSVYHVPAA
jgi:hypothetical protein